MDKLRYALLKESNQWFVVAMPEDHMYQLTALHVRLHKELDKLTVDQVPSLANVIAECNDLDVLDENLIVKRGFAYLSELEQRFAGLQEKNYPLISLLTEIRALQAQMEQWEEEQEEYAGR